MAFITGRFESPSEREACFSTTKTTLTPQQEAEVCALELRPPAVPKEIPGVLWGQHKTIPGTCPLAPSPAVWGSLSDLFLGMEEGRHVVKS